jgi:hypothetical protein
MIPLMNTGRSIFTQLTDLIPRRAFELAVARHHGERRPLKLSCREQLLFMLFAQFTSRSSLRETTTCLRALGGRLYHLGIRTTPARSTLADANEQRDYRIFMDTALSMIAAARVEFPIDPELQRLDIHAAYALDSTTIDLCLKLFPWAHFRRRKAAIKAHIMLDLRSGIPVFMRVTHAKVVDMTTLDYVAFHPGAYYVLDRGYVDFARLFRLHQAKAYFITRPRRILDYRVIRRLLSPANGPVTHDQLVVLRGPKSRYRFPETLRRIRYVDPETGKRLIFLTNHLDLDAVTVALLYRKRWQIELLFKWMKQHLHIKAFFGTTPNAVQLQLWVAVIAMVLIHSVKHLYGLTHSPNEIAQILGLTLLEKTPINRTFFEARRQTHDREDPNQLTLFNL